MFTRGGGDSFEDHGDAGCRQRPDCPRYEYCPKNGADVAACDTERWERVFWQEMLDQGIFLTANQYESQFVSYAHTDEDVEETLAAYRQAL
jgi:glutamate-1-semialdehyde 2,1-aminomutase